MFFHEKLFFNWLKYWTFFNFETYVKPTFPHFHQIVFSVAKSRDECGKINSLYYAGKLFFFYFILQLFAVRCISKQISRIFNRLSKHFSLFFFFCFIFRRLYIIKEVYMYSLKKNDVEIFLSITVTDMQLRMKKGGAFNTIYTLFEFSIDFVLL